MYMNIKSMLYLPVPEAFHWYMSISKSALRHGEQIDISRIFGFHSCEWKPKS